MPNNRYGLLGNGVYPYGPGSNEFFNHIDFYGSENLSLVSSKLPIHMKPEKHEHDSFEFTVPFGHSPLLSVDKKEIIVKNNMVTSCNPGQVHGPACSMIAPGLIALQIKREFIEDISEEMSGKRNVRFENEAVAAPENLFNQLREYMVENSFMQSGYQLIIEALSIQIAVNLLRNIKSNISHNKEYDNLPFRKNINRVIELMHENCNCSFTVNDMAREANLSKYHFIRVFKSETGVTPYEYLMDIKIQMAKQLLKKKQYTVTEICFLLGFTDHSHFTKIFKKKTGYTPTEYRT